MAITNESVNRATIKVNKNDPYPGVVARPLNSPDFINVRPKNPNITFRWVNRSVGVQESTMRLDQMTYAGFEPATPEDCQNVMKDLIKNGKIVFGDLILMKIAKPIYDGALKHNFQRAVNRLHPKAQLQTGQEALKQTLRETNSRIPDLNKKIQAFRPNEAEIQKLENQEDGPLDLGVKNES